MAQANLAYVRTGQGQSGGSRRNGAWSAWWRWRTMAAQMGLVPPPRSEASEEKLRQSLRDGILEHSWIRRHREDSSFYLMGGLPAPADAHQDTRTTPSHYASPPGSWAPLPKHPSQALPSACGQRTRDAFSLGSESQNSWTPLPMSPSRSLSPVSGQRTPEAPLSPAPLLASRSPVPPPAAAATPTWPPPVLWPPVTSLSREPTPLPVLPLPLLLPALSPYAAPLRHPVDPASEQDPTAVIRGTSSCNGGTYIGQEPIPGGPVERFLGSLWTSDCDSQIMRNPGALTPNLAMGPVRSSSSWAPESSVRSPIGITCGSEADVGVAGTDARCRRCGRSLLMNTSIKKDMALENAQLVQVLDSAWDSCARAYSQRAAVQRQAINKAREVEEMRRLVEQLRHEYPPQVQQFVQRAMGCQRERFSLGFASSVPDIRGTTNIVVDTEWHNFCESVKHRVAGSNGGVFSCGCHAGAQSCPAVNPNVARMPPVVAKCVAVPPRSASTPCVLPCAPCTAFADDVRGVATPCRHGLATLTCPGAGLG